MKRLFIAASIIIALASCGKPTTQVMRQDGTIETVFNPEHLELKIGDSITLYRYTSLNSMYDNREIRGFWKGILPAGSMDTTHIITYEVVVVYRP